jgi:hypothetical protein
VECSCITYYDFVLTSTDCRALLYEDLSTFDGASGAYTISIKTPGFDDEVTVVVEPGIVNKITAVDLGLSDDEDSKVPDGIYCITADNCGTIHDKSVAISCNLRCKYDYEVSNLSNEPTLPQIQRLDLIDYYIKAVEQNALRGKTDRAQYFYKRVKGMLTCNNCGC